jgi:glutamate dehydrogenase
MAVANQGEGQKIITKVCAYIKEHAPAEDAKLLDVFARRYLSSLSVLDIRDRSIEDLYNIVRSQLSFMNPRKPGESKVRVFNPSKKEQGWDSPHTIIQVSNDDIPFIVDSTRMVINRHGHLIHFIIHLGGMKVIRDSNSNIIEILPPHMDNKNAHSSAPVYIEIDRLSDANDLQELQAEIENVLRDVSIAVIDWRKIVRRVEESLRELDSCPQTLDAADVAEARDFLRWLINNNFTFLGARDYKLIGDGANRALQAIPGTGLGVLREELSSPSSRSYAKLPPQAQKMALSKDVLIIAKTNTKSTVHRDDYTDYIGVKRFNEKGELIGERRFIGLYTSIAYHSSPRQIPFLRHKVAKVLEELGYPPDSHDGKEAVHIIETLPRDDLFQASQQELLDLTRKIIHLKERKFTRLLIRKDAFARYFSCLVYVPREVFNTNLAIDMQDILMKSLKGIESSYTTYFSDSVLARIHYMIRVNPKDTIEYDVDEIEKKLISASRSWLDDLRDQAIETFGDALGIKYFNKYKKSFTASYKENYSSTEAVRDIEEIERLSKENSLGMLFTPMHARERDLLSLKLFHSEQIIILSDVMPIIENMGLRVIGERPHEVRITDGSRVWINEFVMDYPGHKIDIANIHDTFIDAFRKTWFNEAENDGFNKLVVLANLTWQETAMLRAYAKYLRQTGFTFSQQYIEQTLINNAEITKALVQLFVLRFDPHYSSDNKSNIDTLLADIEKLLDSVASLDEDRILRRYLEVVQATLRTNYFQEAAEGGYKSYISFKFNPAAISDLPLPRPKYEIFVYSPRVEGVHLRAGKVARGGLRWSDRREDFRTEVLGLMKAQQVKNTVIVPEGAKGGFFVKSPNLNDLSRDDYQKEGIACYSIFISGLLDITDNIKDGKIVPPPSVVRYDEDDPYLVVAADKGTATFSDIANSISKAYDFWLHDAFASGGSAGYDHKKMGITSRGVWVSVRRHFRELGIDPDKDDFTVIGIGDMAGDVFGNGMLLSKHIKLLGAFNHMHIFVDPDPNPEISYEERKRLFNLPRSSWTDYNAELISKGGGIFNRSAKSIRLSHEMKKMLGVTKDAMSPNELIRSMLMAQVDLIFNGGIGTFVKSTNESQLDVGDRTNDNIRLDAPELHARVIAEGGNLGMTQMARVEYSLQGGIVNTDFIDNSAGVDCSDHEVNIKILLNQLLAEGKLTLEDRNQLLEKMTNEVADLVLLDNYDQTQMLSLETTVSPQTVDLLRQYMNDLEKSGRLDRKLEFLPSNKALQERKASNSPLTRPELAMLLAYSKMYLKHDILKTNVPDDAFFDKYLLTAFPKPICENYLEQVKRHSLRREIISTQLTKAITDRMGISFVDRLHRETGASMDFIIRSFVVAEDIYNLEDLWKQITALDYKVDPAVQYRMMLQVYSLIRRATRWFLRNRKQNIEMQKTIDIFKPLISQIIGKLPELLDAADKEAVDVSIQDYISHGVPSQLAESIANCNVLFTSLDIAEASLKYELNLEEAARTYYRLGNRLELNYLREMMNSYVVDTQWDELARAGFRDDLDRAQRKLVSRILTIKNRNGNGKIAAKNGINGKAVTTDERIDLWVKRYHFLLDRWQKLLADIRSSDIVGFVTYSVVLRELFEFAQAS